MSAEPRPLSPAEEAALDARFGTLPVLAPPPGLAEATLSAVMVEISADNEPVAPILSLDHARRRPRLPVALGAGLALAAGALLALLPPRHAPADPADLVERGVGERLPAVALKVAVLPPDGAPARLSREARYAEGDTLYFRASVDAQAWLTLVRVDARGATVFHQQALPPGEADLALAEGPLAWRLEAGEGDALFAILASSQPLSAPAVEAALGRAYNGGEPAALCRAAATLDSRCSAELVRMRP